MGSKSSKNQEIIEGVVCKESDIPENGMKEFPFGEDGKVLMVKQKGQIYAVGPKCSHYGAQLVNGALGNGRVRCPWHGACFNLTTGDIEDCPGLDSLPCYKVKVQPNGDVKICGIKSTVKTAKRLKPMAKADPKSSQTFLILGGGAAGSSCAETLRQEGFTGKIIVISEEKYLPYDRVKCSKQLDVKIENILLRSEDFYKSHDIEFVLEEEATKIDCEKKVVTTFSKKEFSYDKLFIAIGIRARYPFLLSIKPLPNLFTIREITDSQQIVEQLTPDTELAVVGTSFVGMESAAFCTGKVKSVTVIGATSVPFERVLGKEVGGRIGRFFESKGVKFINNAKAQEYIENEGKLSEILLTDGARVSTDLCIAGIGSFFETVFLANAGFSLNNLGAVNVDKFLKTSQPDVFAGGDVAAAPVYGTERVKKSIGHWQMAQYHGKIAAKNMLGQNVSVQSVPYFFSMLFGMGLRYAGFGEDFEDTLTVGDLEGMKFVTYYFIDNKAVAAASIASDPIVSKFAELLHQGKTITKEEAAENKWLKTYGKDWS